MRKPFFPLIILISLTLASCSYILNNLPGVYRIDIQQGNMIDQAMIDQLRPNMTKRQVLYILGSPMMADAFHQKRWDYIYSAELKGEDRLQKRVTLVFNDDQLVGVQGDFKPSKLPVLKTSEEQTVDLPKRELDKTLWEMITGLFGSDESSKAPEQNGSETKNILDYTPEEPKKP
ncbi:MAG: outer membrane protein assembly factor BamE [Methylococcales bacterium]